ncbi:MAG: sugar phosphorylase [Treponema sp.]|jgi:sucrose phosphorylase|nr:sugar phosphorylase [Treponema sp.]
MKHIKDLLSFIYGRGCGEDLFLQLNSLLDARRAAVPRRGRKQKISCRDAFLIAYADMLSGSGGETALSRLARFVSAFNKGSFSYLHLLPFHPYSSDDGFSVIDYTQVDGRFGGWNDLETLKTIPAGKEKLRLAFDLVVNHGSVQSKWFREFLAGTKEYASYYIIRDKNYDSRGVFRPRTHPLLSEFKKENGEPVWVWTTFSADQADYDFSNPKVLFEFITVLLDYARRGAGIIRLDAIAYLWKEDGTRCLHHPKTHAVVKLFRAIIDYLELPVLLLTETNVPHDENISYFGAGTTGLDGLEAHMVYNFALPPLVLHASLSGDAGPLREWAKTLPARAQGRYFLNFLASHDGVGLTPAQGLIDPAAFAATVEKAKQRGALVSCKSGPDGDVPYELNCSYASIVAPKELGPVELRAKAFLAAYAALFFLSGLPAVYFHSWIGSEAWTEGPQKLGYNRAINREKPDVSRVEAELACERSFRRLVYNGFQKMLAYRASQELFDPECTQKALDAPAAVFAVERSKGKKSMICLVNFSRDKTRWTDKKGGITQALGPFEARIILK